MIYYTENQIDDLRTVMAAKDAEIVRLRSLARTFADALDTVLDGEQDHDIDPGPTGMTQEQCDLVIAARASAREFLATARAALANGGGE